MPTIDEQIEKAQATSGMLQEQLNLAKHGLVQNCTDDHVDLLQQMVRTLHQSIANEITQVVPTSQKHHFVPKFYLKAWSDARKPRNIHLYNIPKDVVTQGPWKDQCQRSNYYGRMEKSVLRDLGSQVVKSHL